MIGGIDRIGWRQDGASPGQRNFDGSHAALDMQINFDAEPGINPS
jgi:hypothetical protein